MGNINDIRINESLSLLKDFNPSLIRKIEQTYPEYKELLKSGIMLGTDDDLATQVKSLVSKDKLLEAISVIKETGTLSDEITLQEAAYKEVMVNYRDGLIDYEQYQRQMVRIRKALIILANEITNGITDISRSTPNHQTIEESIKKETELRLELVISSLRIVTEQCEKVIPQLKQKIKRLNNLQLISQIIIAISGASLLTVLNSETSKIMNLVIGFLTLSGSLLTIYVQYKSYAMDSSSKSLLVVYEEISNLYIDADHNLAELKVYGQLETEASANRLRELISNGNELCLRLRKLLNLV